MNTVKGIASEYQRLLRERTAAHLAGDLVTMDAVQRTMDELVALNGGRVPRTTRRYR